MKRFLLFFLAFSPLMGKTQTSKNTTINSGIQSYYNKDFSNSSLYSYTIGFKLFSYEEFPKILNQTDPDAFRKSLWNGFILKYNDNQISYRFSGSFYSNRLSFSNECEECEIIEGRLKDGQVKVGFEKNLTYGVIQPYFGADIGIRRSAFKGKTQTTASAPYDVKTEKNGLTFSPVFGIKLNLIDRLTIAAESTVDILYSYERQEKIYTNSPDTQSLQKYYKWEYLLKPVGMLTLQYNFGEIY